jgi:PST family polysaccharide transporter
VLNIGVMAILARQLTPADFGLFALAQVILRFLTLLGSGGVGDYVIFDKQEGRAERLQAAFWLNMTMTLAAASVALCLIPVISRFYTITGLSSVLVALIARYIIGQMIIVPDAIVKRSLDYQRLVIRETILEIAGSLSSVVLALMGWGVWSLIIPSLCIAPLQLALALKLSRWRPELPLRIGQWREITRYSFNVIGVNLVTSITAEGDTLLIGRMLGVVQLGVYNLAWQSANIISRNISGVVGKIAMPALSAVAGDRERLQQAFNRMLRVLAIFSFPPLIGLFVTADIFIMVLYGPQWTGSIVPLQILIIYALRHSVGSPASVIYNVVGRPEVGLRYGLVFAPFYLLSIFIGSHYGIIGVAIGVTLSRSVFGFLQLWVGARLVGERFTELLSQLVSPLSAAAIMGAMIYMIKLVCAPLPIPKVILLSALILLGGVIWCVLAIKFFRQQWEEVLQVISALSPALGTRLRTFTGFTQPANLNEKQMEA